MQKTRVAVEIINCSTVATLILLISINGALNFTSEGKKKKTKKEKRGKKKKRREGKGKIAQPENYTELRTRLYEIAFITATL